MANLPDASLVEVKEFKVRLSADTQKWYCTSERYPQVSLGIFNSKAEALRAIQAFYAQNGIPRSNTPLYSPDERHARVGYFNGVVTSG